MDGWHPLGHVGPIGATPTVVPVPGTGRTVLLVRTADGVLHATDPACPHQGQPLSDALVEGGVIECSHHTYRYALADGRCEHEGPLGGHLTVHEVREGEEGVEVRLAGDGATSVGDA